MVLTKLRVRCCAYFSGQFNHVIPSPKAELRIFQHPNRQFNEVVASPVLTFTCTALNCRSMDLRTEILAEHSRAQSLRLAAWIGRRADRFAGLMQLFLEDDYRVVQRAAWIVSFVAERHPELLTPHLPAMVARMEEGGLPVAVKRNVLRVLQYLSVPESLHGPVMNSCFAFLEDPLETVAVKAFSMTVLAQLAKAYPDIKNEIRLLIAAELENNPTPGIRSRARKVLKEIQ